MTTAQLKQFTLLWAVGFAFVLIVGYCFTFDDPIGLATIAAGYLACSGLLAGLYLLWDLYLH
jgi:hypothetical protein